MMGEPKMDLGSPKTPEKNEEAKFYIVQAGGSECAASIKGPYTQVEAQQRYDEGGNEQVHPVTEILDETEAKRRIAEEFNQYENYTNDIDSPEED